jgi:hypothetical protein
MASIHKELVVEAPPAAVWAAFRDVGNIQTRLAREFVVNTRLDGDSRLVTFANGVTVRERIVDVDDDARRLSYAVVDSPPITFHHASFQVFPEGSDRSRIVWIADLLPNEAAPTIEGMMEQGCRAMARTLSAHVNAS